MTALKSEANSRAQIADLLRSLSPSAAPETRSQAKKKQNRTSQHVTEGPTLDDTPLPELCVDGMDEEQIWAQMELRAQNLCKVLEYALQGAGEEEEDDEVEREGKAMKKKIVTDDADVDVDEMDVDVSDEDSEDEDEDADSEDEGEDSEEESADDIEGSDGSDEEIQPEEDVVELRDPSDEENELDLDATGTSSRKKRGKSRSKGHPELDDGFFDLAAFNAETEQAEARAVSKGRLGRRDEDSDEEDVELEGVDMFAPVDGENGQDEDEGVPI